METKVYISNCIDYNESKIKTAFKETILDNNLLDFVKPKMKIAIKVNLVAAATPDKAVTTNPVLVKVLCEEIVKRGAYAIIGDSPGGLFNSNTLRNIYKESGMLSLVSENISVNDNFNQEIRKINGKVVSSLDCSSWLLEADAIINFAKLKSHGMMALSACTKNMFGSIPGLLKPGYHYRYPNHADFADMLIDIQEFYKCNLHLLDAIVGMEGNGPTQGTPRNIGLFMASKSPYAIDEVAAYIIGLTNDDVPSITQAIKRDKIPVSVNELDLSINVENFVIKDYKNIKPGKNMEFNDKFKGPFGKTITKMVAKILRVKPKVVKKECIGCKKCANICPAKAIEMKNGKPIIDRNKCIRCFCCQEFCPKGAMKAHKSFIIKFLTKTK